MKKAVIYGVVFLWMAVILVAAGGRGKAENSAVEVFQRDSFTEESCVIKFQGQYLGSAETGEEKEALFLQLAEGLGIRDGYTLGWNETDGREMLIFQKEGRYGDTQMVWLSVPEEEAIYEGNLETVSVQIRLHGPGDAPAWQDHLGALCREAGFAGETEFCLKGYCPGNLSLEERDRLAEALFSLAGAENLSGSRTMELYTLYGYSSGLGTALYTNGRKINLNLALYYDEREDRTVILLGCPVLKSDF